jgi:predicted RNA binding protein YcfA (HicA-like mRNA interferase family)
MDSRKLMQLLRENGFEVIRIKGSHHQMKKEGWPSTVTVPHPKKQLGPGLVNAILKQAGLK